MIMFNLLVACALMFCGAPQSDILSIPTTKDACAKTDSFAIAVSIPKIDFPKILRNFV